MLGVPPAPQQSPAPDLKGTMLGVAPAPEAPVSNIKKGTVPGVGPRAGASAPADVADETEFIRPAESTFAPAEPIPSPRPEAKRTAIGVAQPGIAPLYPDAPKPVAQPSWQPSHAPDAPRSPAAPPLARAGASSALSKHKKAWIALLAGAVVLIGAAIIVMALLLPSRTALSGEVSLDDAGAELVELSCANCSDGTVAIFGNARAPFQNGSALLKLGQPLRVGNNQLFIGLNRAGGDTETVELNVPVEFRIHSALSALDDNPPKLRVKLRAVAGTSAVIDGKPLTLGSDGTAAYELNVAQELTGQALGAETLERRIPYVITPPDATPHKDTIIIRLAIVPLLIESPGETIIVDTPHFMLAGLTQKEATLTVAGRAISVDASGRFAQLMSVSSEGETTIVVRASAPGRAPRLVPVQVKRVPDLRAEAKRFSKQATTAYKLLALDPAAKQGLAVAFTAKVAEARVENHTTLMLIEVESSCENAPCFARVVFGAKAPVATGNRIDVYGHVLGAVEGPRSGTNIPEIRADFILKDRT
jgi:hypothetical protein